MNILVTGAKGFIGSCLTARAMDQGHKVIAVDDLSRGLNAVELVENVKFVPHDCRNGIAEILDEYSYLEAEYHWTGRRVDKQEPLDAVVHLAAGTGSLDRPYEELVELNVNMTQNIFSDAITAGVKVFVFPTTSLIEGVPDSPYVRSKQDAMDWLCAQSKAQIKVVPLQFYNVSGAYKSFSEHRRREVHLIPVMLDKFMKEEPLIINGDDYDTVDGTPGRDFSNIVDVCDIILRLISSQLKQPFTASKPIKIGTGVITTTKQAIDAFNTLVAPIFEGRELKYEIGPRRAFDCGWLRCDQPYLHIFRRPALFEQSLKDEIKALLKVVYGKEI